MTLQRTQTPEEILSHATLRMLQYPDDPIQRLRPTIIVSEILTCAEIEALLRYWDDEGGRIPLMYKHLLVSHSFVHRAKEIA